MSITVVNKNILLSDTGGQVMMLWEKPYMEASIDNLEPTGDVLEIGFGLGFSATQIMKHNPKSYTIIECDPTIIKKIETWRENYPHIPIHIIEGRWQDKLSNLGIFDEIYFDDYPLDIHDTSSDKDKIISQNRLRFFLAQCIQNHMRVGSKISWYMGGNNSSLYFSNDITLFTDTEFTTVPVTIPETCKYRNIKEQFCTIPIMTKIAEFDFLTLLQNPAPIPIN